MKTRLTIILLFLLQTASFAQPSPKEEVYNILRGNIFDASHINIAKRSFEDYIARYSTNPYRLVAIYWLAEIHNKLKNTDSSGLLYAQAVAMVVPDTVDNSNFRRSSAMRLAEFAIAGNDYDAALNYLDLANEKFILRADCGYGRMEDGVRMVILYSGCYIGQGNYTQAIDTLTPYMFSRMQKYSTIVLDKLYEAYGKIHTKKEIKQEFLNAEKHIIIKRIQYPSYTHVQPTITIFGKEICIPDDDVVVLNRLPEEKQKQWCIETLRRSAIYKLATR
jgi:tetratricopeptide (TPR) repeat protein